MINNIYLFIAKYIFYLLILFIIVIINNNNNKTIKLYNNEVIKLNIIKKCK
jgi:hypothetical protein